MREEYERRKALIPLLVRWNNLTFYTSMLGIVLTVVEMELSRHLYKYDPDQWAVPFGIKATVTFSTVFLLFFV